MTHDELLAEIDEHISWHKDTYTETYAEYITRCTCQEKKYPCDGKKAWVSLRAVVELHKCSNPRFDLLCDCGKAYPCLTIQAIEKELK